MKKSIITLLLAAISATTFAQTVTLQQAQQRAVKFLNKEAHPLPLPKERGERTLSKVPTLQGANEGDSSLPYYIFNAVDGQGFVIVSGDERAREVLGYSASGSLTEESMPCGLEMLLAIYSEEIESLTTLTSSPKGEGEVYANVNAPKKAMATRASINPLLSCQWGQSSPYNGRCPTSGNSRCIVGCAATATSQVMYYWGHQQGNNLPTTTIPAYTTRTLGLNCAELPATTFDWASMKDKGSSDAAAAKLCRYVGQALQMDYGTSGSEAWGSDIGIVYRDFFGYDKHTRLVFRQDYDYDVFEEMIYNEIAEGRPVVITGSYINTDGTSWGGHSFVCDGYQASNGYYHINWGWNGQDDGYFPLSALNSSLNSWGGSNTTGKGFDIYLNCVIGIQPPVEGHEYEKEAERTAIVDMSLTGARTFTRESVEQDFEGITVFNAVYNHLQYNTELVAGLGLYDAEGNLLDVLAAAPLGRFDRYDGFGLEFTFGNLALGRGLKEGTYYIRAISKAYPQSLPEGMDGLSGDGWLLSTGAEHNYITATISEKELKLQPSVDLEITQVGSTGGSWSRTYSATITNNGTEESRGLLYAFSTSKLVNVVQTDIAAGETKTVSLSATSIAKITSDFDGHHVLWTNSSAVPNIALTAHAANADFYGRFEGQTLLLDVSVANNGTTAYTTQVTAKICKEGTTQAIASKSFIPNVAAKSTQTERLTFEGLDYGQPYTIKLSSGSYTVEQGNMTTSQPRTFFVYTVTPVEKTVVDGDSNGDSSVTIADVTTLVNIILGTSPNPSQGGEYSAADVNGDGAVTIADVTALVNIILGK